MIVIMMRVIYIAPKNVKQTHRRIKSHCTSAKRMTSILRLVAEAFPPARQGGKSSYTIIMIVITYEILQSCM